MGISCLAYRGIQYLHAYIRIGAVFEDQALLFDIYPLYMGRTIDGTVRV